MIKNKILVTDRVRSIDGGFSFIPHHFVTGGFLSALSQKELLLYFFLVIVSDRKGLSFYGYDKICTLLELSLDDYLQARNGLMDKDMIAFDGTVFQVLDLPKKPIISSNRENHNQAADQSTITELIAKTTKRF